jgi:SAM-dependent methyltransferase
LISNEQLLSRSGDTYAAQNTTWLFNRFTTFPGHFLFEDFPRRLLSEAISMSLTENTVEIWDKRYATEDRENRIKYERWLDRWIELLGDRKGRALDLGCGPGFDTSLLLGLGFDVTALDFSKTAIAISQQRNPLATHHVADIRKLDEIVNGEFPVIVANLSLHYFNRVETEAIFATIMRHLSPGGFFAFRLNAYDEHGAPSDRSSWDMISVDGVAKQFFDERKITHLLGPTMEIVSIEKRTTDRFGRRKSLFESVAVKHAL